MIDYKKSVLAGIEASEDADRNKSEIQNVVTELSAAVSEATEGKVGVHVQQFREPASSRGHFGGFLSPIPRELLEPPEPKFYSGLAVYRRENGGGIEIATWDISTSGYPVSLGGENGVHDCHDRESLQRQLNDLLQTPTAGAAIRKAISQPPN